MLPDCFACRAWPRYVIGAGEAANHGGKPVQNVGRNLRKKVIGRNDYGVQKPREGRREGT